MVGEPRRRRAPESVLAAAPRFTPALLRALPDGVKRLAAGGRAVVVDGNTLDPALQAFIASLRVSGVTGLVFDDNVALSRRMFGSLAPLGGRPAPAEVTELSIPGPAGPIPVRHYRAPTGDPPAPALLYFHGGGWVLGGLDSYDLVCRRLCRGAGAQVFSVDYRLAPEHPAPAALDDCVAAYHWVLAHARELGVPADRVAVGGDSAGGNLAAALTHAVRDAGEQLPYLQLLIYPLIDVRAPTRSRTLFSADFVLTGHDIAWFGDRYLADSELAADDPRVSPVRAADLSGLPPALVVTAGFDPLRDEGNAYAAALAAAGVPVDLREMTSMTHGFINFDGFGGGVSRAIAEVVSALRAHLSRAGTDR